MDLEHEEQEPNDNEDGDVDLGGPSSSNWADSKQEVVSEVQAPDGWAAEGVDPRVALSSLLADDSFIMIKSFAQRKFSDIKLNDSTAQGKVAVFASSTLPVWFSLLVCCTCWHRRVSVCTAIGCRTACCFPRTQGLVDLFFPRSIAAADLTIRSSFVTAWQRGVHAHAEQARSRPASFLLARLLYCQRV